MSKNSLERVSRIALFRGKEEEPGIPAVSSGVSMAFDSGSEIKSTALVEHDAETIHGAELPGRLYTGHRQAKGSLSQKRAKPDFLAFVLAYFFGKCESVPAGPSAFSHIISPTPDLLLPSFTVLQRRGANIFTERLAGNYIEAFTLELGEGWVSCAAEVVGTGCRETNYFHEKVTAPANTEELVLAEKGVEGESPAERLANVYRVRAKKPGSRVWEVLRVTAVSSGAPAVLMLAGALSQESEEVVYHIDYLPGQPDWCRLPDFEDESPLRLVEARVVVDGFFDGQNLLGGEELRSEMLGFSLRGKNNLELRHYPGEAGPAALAVRGGRELTIGLTESLRNSVRQYQADYPETETISLALVLAGAEIDSGSGLRFGAELIFPRCGLLAAPVVVQGERLAQAGDLIVMEDEEFGAAIVRCYNRQPGYLTL